MDIDLLSLYARMLLSVVMFILMAVVGYKRGRRVQNWMTIWMMSWAEKVIESRDISPARL